MNLPVVGPFINAVLFLCLFLIVWLKKRASRPGRVFALFCYLTFHWQFSWTILFSTHNPNLASALVKVGYSGIIFLPITLYHFLVVFTNSQREIIFIKSFYALGVIFLLFLWATDLFTCGYYKYSWGFYPKANPVLHPVYLLLVLYVVFRLINLLYLHYKSSLNYNDKNQAKYLLLAFLIYAFAASDYIVNYGVDFYPLGLIPTSIANVIFTYTILKHNLFDINIVFRKITGYSLLIALLFIFSVTVLFLTSRFFGNLFPKQTIWSTLFIITILALVFQPLYRWTNSRIDKWFFKGTLPDISAEKSHLEEELRRSERLAAIGMLASGLLHEMKNSLVPIRAQVELLPRHNTEREFIQKITATIPYEVDRITKLLGQLKEFANPAELKTEQVDLTKILDDRLTFLKDLFAQRKIRVNKLYNSTDSTISGDPGKLSQVFSNLFDNAVGAMPQGGVLTVSCKQSTIPGQDKPAVLVKVQDTGFGIPKEDLTKIFDPFFTKKTHGTGLGLAVSHQIIKNHGGMILVESEVGKGTAFEIFLPK